MSIRPLIIDRYLFREFVLSFIAVMSFCALLILVASIFDRFSEIMEFDAPLDVVILFFLTGLPAQLMQIVPIGSMLAVLFSIGSLARTNEILAMLTNGVHGLRLAVPIVFGGIIIVIGSFIMNEYLVPPLERANQEYDLLLEDRDLREIKLNANVFARGKNEWFYMARVYSKTDNEMLMPMVVNLTPDRSNLLQRIEGKKARFISNDSAAKSSQWLFEKPRIWQFDSSGHVTTFTESKTSEVISLEEDLTTILSQQMRPDEMNFNELNDRIRIMEARDQPVFAMQTDLLKKVTFPFGILVIMLIGFSYAVRTRPGTAMAVFGYGIIWAVAYYVANAIFQALGHSGSVSPIIATVFPTVVFGILAAHYVRKSYLWHS